MNPARPDRPPAVRQRRQRPLTAADRRQPTAKRQGLSQAQVAAVYARQEGRCAVCGRPLGSWYVVDHDHALAAAHGHAPERGCPSCVRGLLDRACNAGLSMFGDDPDTIRRALAYSISRRA